MARVGATDTQGSERGCAIARTRIGMGIWTPETPMLDPQLSWLNITRPGEPRTDVTMRMIWGNVGDRQIVEMKSRMEKQDLNLWDWYVVPAGALDWAFGRRTQWVDGGKMVLITNSTHF